MLEERGQIRHRRPVGRRIAYGREQCGGTGDGIGQRRRPHAGSGDRPPSVSARWSNCGRLPVLRGEEVGQHELEFERLVAIGAGRAASRLLDAAIANELVSIQPMSAPVGAVFYFEYKHGKSKGHGRRDQHDRELRPALLVGADPVRAPDGRPGRRRVVDDPGAAILAYDPNLAEALPGAGATSPFVVRGETAVLEGDNPNLIPGDFSALCLRVLRLGIPGRAGGGDLCRRAEAQHGGRCSLRYSRTRRGRPETAASRSGSRAPGRAEYHAAVWIRT